MKKHNIHLAVDGIRTPDGQQLKGFTHDLQSPVYVGHGQLQMLHKTYVRMCNFLISASSLTTSLVFLYKVITLFFSQGEVPQKSIIGCIRDLRVSKVLFAHPAVNHGIMPCFKGVTETGAYFAGNGAHLVLGLALHVDTYVYSDRKIGSRNEINVFLWQKSTSSLVLRMTWLLKFDPGTSPALFSTKVITMDGRSLCFSREER